MDGLDTVVLHALLTQLIFPRSRASNPSRIVWPAPDSGQIRSNIVGLEMAIQLDRLGLAGLDDFFFFIFSTL